MCSQIKKAVKQPTQKIFDNRILLKLSNKVKIINDPVYGFLRFPEPEVVAVINHRWLQRLRNIRQMGMAHLVYPGAMHTRLHHSIGACHLMGKALDELRLKSIPIDKEEYTAARLAALLHDIGHGPFSHSLEYVLVNVPHEVISKLLIEKMDAEMGGMLTPALQIFEREYPKPFLHQLVSSQLDIDRMDYLNRDSFFTGVSEGVIGYDRILNMLTVNNNQLVVEEKGLQSVEKFIIARRLMYWQVYLHKTVIGAERLLINIITRAKELINDGISVFATPSFNYFLTKNLSPDDFINNPEHLEAYCNMDDTDILASIKEWQKHSDSVLSTLSKMLFLRKLYKIFFVKEDVEALLLEKTMELQHKYGVEPRLIKYYAFSGVAKNNTYNIENEMIKIEMKNGAVKNITELEDTLVNQTVARSVQKNYICYTQF